MHAAGCVSATACGALAPLLLAWARGRIRPNARSAAAGADRRAGIAARPSAAGGRLATRPGTSCCAASSCAAAAAATVGAGAGRLAVARGIVSRRGGSRCALRCVGCGRRGPHPHPVHVLRVGQRGQREQTRQDQLCRLHQAAAAAGSRCASGRWKARLQAAAAHHGGWEGGAGVGCALPAPAHRQVAASWRAQRQRQLISVILDSPGQTAAAAAPGTSSTGAAQQQHR